MPWDFRIIRASDFLRTNVSGALDLEASKRILTELATVTLPGTNFNILVDLRVAEDKMSTDDVYEVVKEVMNHLEVLQGRRIAMLNRPDESFAKTQFFEICTRNRGVMVRAFTDFEESMNWLAAESGVNP